ncbi:MAG: putative sulfate exporter family transporter, partial [Planctomycetota bacterium]
MPRSEDVLAALLGGGLLLVCLAAVLIGGGDEASNPLRPYLAAPGGWSQLPWETLDGRLAGLIGVAATMFVAFAVGARLSGEALGPFARGYAGVFCLALLAYVISKQAIVAQYGFAYMLWAIVLGLLAANTIGAPSWVRPALRAELYTKVGLVLLGAEVLLGRLLALGLPGIGVAWIVTPIVLCATYWFGCRVLRIDSPSLSMVVAADMSVCGVSAAIATAAACRAKKEELSLAIGLSLLFTAVMMVVLPAAVAAMGLGPYIGGAWIGGTIDSTGAVAAAGAALGDDALQVAATIKMIQNILVGITAFGVATYWVTVVDRRQVSGVRLQEVEQDSNDYPKPEARSPKPALAEVWHRFPQFILG